MATVSFQADIWPNKIIRKTSKGTDPNRVKSHHMTGLISATNFPADDITVRSEHSDL